VRILLFGNSQVRTSYTTDTFDIVEEDREILYQWTKEICKYRLHQYFERRDRENE